MYLRSNIDDWVDRFFAWRRAIPGWKLDSRLAVSLLNKGELLVFEKLIEQLFAARRSNPEVFCNLSEHGTDGITRTPHVERAEAENAQVLLFGICARRGGDLRDGSRFGHQLRAPGALPFQFSFNASVDLLVGQAVSLAEFQQVRLGLGRQHPALDRKADELD